MNKSLLTLLGVLVALLVIYLIIDSARDVTEQTESFFALDTNKVDGFTIINKHDTINLKRRASGWNLGEPLDYPADSRFTGNVIEKLATMDIETLITEDSSKASQFEVDTAGVEVMVFEGADTVAHFMVGKTSPDRRHTYCSFVGDDKIYLLKGTFTSQLNRKKKDWRDKSILEIDPESVNKLDFTYPDEVFSLEKTDTTWIVDKRGLLLDTDEQMVNRVVRSISRFRTFDFVDGDTVQVVDFSVPTLSLVVHTDVGDTYKFDFVPESAESKRYLIHKEGVEKALFVIHQGAANSIFKHVEDFKKKEHQQ
ncbi:hypothetical protein CEE37_02155 [candidate division LCP-89 bacterium B3_LCP]|uniref:DUF4340 domain-containing protein n=1 Tax=candidate division LCP-89 bacterium B3_LCP TaxID=2012998 RepID=A0A532V5P5_UNCL8|nr:MAG: hypothetical protein CEE37_02155 [candidate division LCP-89 bacterium B3_LCP]